MSERCPDDLGAAKSAVVADLRYGTPLHDVARSPWHLRLPRCESVACPRSSSRCMHQRQKQVHCRGGRPQGPPQTFRSAETQK